MEFLAQFHPKVVHFPIALLLTYTLLEVIGAVFKKEFFSNAAFVLLLLGVLGALASVITGHQAAALAEKWDEIGTEVIPAIPFKMIREHEEWANILLWYFAGVLVLRTFYLLRVQIKGRFPKLLHTGRYIFVVLALFGSFFIYQTGEHGGQLVYKKGVGTDLIKPAEPEKESEEK